MVGQAAAFQELEPGRWIGDRYCVESTLGRGGMGAVYRVLDSQTGRAVALKQLYPPRQDHSILLEQFEREYHTLCQLAHPSIIEVYDYCVEDGAAYYTMELLPGEDLRERGTLPWAVACPLLRDVASSLAILHSRKLIHRDISARNVRCTEDGRAKLIDFGAMAPMGVMKHVVGTPPFLPPEALRLQMMDGRSDLYALGALAYWTLTGRTAYPARKLDQLPEVWRTPPAPPRNYQPDIPEPLERLVMELIELEPSARPRTAAEVMERLCGVAGLPLTELPTVSRAYLVTPMLVGREPLLQDVRASLQQASQGRGGGSVLLTGAAGMGRTRMLAASVLEAKLLGAAVLRADGSDASAGDYGAAKALGRALLLALPGIAVRGAQPFRDVLAPLLPELLGAERTRAAVTLRVPSVAPVRSSGAPRYSMLPDAPVVAESTPPVPSAGVQPRSVVLSGLRDWLLAVAKYKGVVIAIDDFDALDEPSAALIAMLAHRARRRRLSLLVTVDAQASESPAYGLLREAARSIELTALSAQDSASLLRSVFGDVDHVASLSERVHQLSGGNPGATMAFAERLVERGVARYEAGSWRLPSAIGKEDLPESLTAALRAQIAGLPAEARELAEVLALTDIAEIPLLEYAQLAGASQSGQVHRALDRLTAASVLVPAGDRFRFGHPELRELLRAGIAPEAARVLHGRIAQAMERIGSPGLHARHLLLAGQERAAIERLCEQLDTPAADDADLIEEVFEPAAQGAERLGFPRRTQIKLRCRLVALASERGDLARFNHYIGPVLRELEEISGLLDFAQVDPELPLPQRWAAAQRAAVSREQAREPDARGPSSGEAIVLLMRLCGASCVLAAVTHDIEALARLPNFKPIAPLSFELYMIAAILEIQDNGSRGRFELARSDSRALIERLEVACKGVPRTDYKNLVRLAQLYMQGQGAALLGRASAREWVAELEQSPGYRSNAWRVRMVYELMLGNEEAARACRTRAELLNLQDTGRATFPGTTTRIELQAAIYSDDIIGIKRAAERMESLAARYPGWRPTLAIARSHYRRVQGDYAGALGALEPALSFASDVYLDWALAHMTEVILLSALGRHDEAIERGLHNLQIAERELQSVGVPALQRVTAEALTRAGRAAEAEPLADALIASQIEQDVHGLQLGLAYETRARIAIARGDEEGLRRYAQLAAGQYRGTHNPTLHAKYKSLMREAEASGMVVNSVLAEAGMGDGTRPAHVDAVSSLFNTVSSRLMDSGDAEDRAREALRLLLGCVGAANGYLYRVEDESLVFVASTESDDPPAELTQLLEGRLRRELNADDEATTFQTGAVAEETAAFTDGVGREFEPLVLFRKSGGERKLAAIAALHYASETRITVQRDVLDTLVAALTLHAVLPAAAAAEPEPA